MSNEEPRAEETQEETFSQSGEISVYFTTPLQFEIGLIFLRKLENML